MSRKLVGGLSRVRPPTARNSRGELRELLRRKSWLLEDVDRHPVCLGVPLGRNGGSETSISVDVGLKNMAQVSTRELAATSPQYKRQLVDRMQGGRLAGQPEDFRSAEPIPMSVLVKEDIQRLPVASAMHPASLARRVPDEVLHALQDPFFNAGTASPELAKIVIDAVPDADAHQTVMREYRKDERSRLFPDER